MTTLNDALYHQLASCAHIVCAISETTGDHERVIWDNAIGNFSKGLSDKPFSLNSVIADLDKIEDLNALLYVLNMVLYKTSVICKENDVSDESFVNSVYNINCIESDNMIGKIMRSSLYDRHQRELSPDFLANSLIALCGSKSAAALKIFQNEAL